MEHMTIASWGQNGKKKKKAGETRKGSLALHGRNGIIPETACQGGGRKTAGRKQRENRRGA